MHHSTNIAFSTERIEDLNRNIVALNGGMFHQPIYKISWYERGTKFPVGAVGCKSKQFVESATGTNLFFAVYEQRITDPNTGLESLVRSYKTFRFLDILEKFKAKAPIDEEAFFILSPFDLVYFQTKEELESGKVSMPLDYSRIYRFVSCNKGDAYFLPHEVAACIKNKAEFEKANKIMQVDGIAIKERCIPLRVDRLGNIVKIGV